MPIEDLLRSYENELIDKSAIPHVGEIEKNKYLYADPSDMDPYFLEEGQEIEDPPTQVGTRSLIGMTSVIGLGPYGTTVDESLLSRKKEEILTKASSSIGDGCFKVAKDKFGLKVATIEESRKIDTALRELIYSDYSDSMLICNPLTLNLLANGFLKGRLPLFKSGKLHLNYFVDGFHPVFTPPRSPSKEMMVCNIRHSFVFSDPKFELRKNNLVFHFKLDVQSIDDVRGFILP